VNDGWIKRSENRGEKQEANSKILNAEEGKLRCGERDNF
jgi:hypothetical protein